MTRKYYKYYSPKIEVNKIGYGLRTVSKGAQKWKWLRTGNRFPGGEESLLIDICRSD